MTQENDSSACPPWRRFLIIFYDSVLLFAVLFIATAIILPFHGGGAIESGNVFYILYLLLCSYFYFTWQWVHGGQTLGMRAWHVRVVSNNGAGLGWPTATRRYLCSFLSLLPMGAGFLWCLFDQDEKTLHDRLSGTRLILVTERK